MANDWIPPPAIPGKFDGDPLTAKDLKDVIASLQAFLQDVITTTTLVDFFVDTPPGNIRYADFYSDASITGGIQEAIDAHDTSGGTVYVNPGTTLTQDALWLHSNVHLEGAGAGSIIKRDPASIADGNPALSGVVINTGPKGFNGTAFSSGSQGANIGLHNLTLDGSSGSLGGITNINLGLSGLRATWVTGLWLENVKAQNLLSDGFYINSCSGILGNGLYTDTVGQFAGLHSKNALTLTNNDNSATNTNQGAISNFYFKNTGPSTPAESAEAIVFNGTADFSIGNGSVDGCDYGIEFTGGATNGNKLVTVHDVEFANVRAYCMTINSSAAITFSHLTFKGLSFECTSAHDGGVVYLAGSAYSLADCTWDGIVATNVNANDAGPRNWIDLQSASGKSRDRLHFSNFTMTGKSTSVRTDVNGIVLRHNVSDCTFSNMTLKWVPGKGVAQDDAFDGQVQTRNRFERITADETNDVGFQVRCNSNAATISETFFDHCIAHNCAKVTSNSGFDIQAAAVGCLVDRIHLHGCRSYGSHAFGAQFARTNGTLSNILIQGCDFSGCATNWITATGTMTLTYEPPRGRGSDITAAATISIPFDGDVFVVTGNTNIGQITVSPWDRGRRAKLIFTGTPTMTAPVTGVKMAGTLGPVTADDSWTLSCDGTNWNEDGRSVNA